MNIKTTIILMVLLLGVGALVFFTQPRDAGDVKPKVHTLVDVKTGDITRFIITGSDGKTIEAQKSADAGGLPIWKLTQPVSASADTMKVTSLLDTLTSLKSTAQISGSDVPHAGLDKPQFLVDLYQNGSDTKLAFGDRLTVSDGVYAQVNGSSKVDVVNTSVLDSLDKPANDLRKTQLFETASPSVQQLTITHRDGTEVVLQKQSKGWQMIKPVSMPADTSAVDDLVSSVVNMTPVEFVEESSSVMGLQKPVATATFSALAASTQPATQPAAAPMPGGVTVVYGGYDDLEKKNIFAQIPDGTIVKVAASVLDSLNKKPFELRDKTVLDIDPTQVNKLILALNQPATTQPTTQPALLKVTEISRRKKDLQVGPVLPGTGPSTRPVSPSLPQSDWVVGELKQVDGDDARVTALLGHFHPLKADNYLEKLSDEPFVKQYTLSLFTNQNPVPMVVTIRDPGSDRPLVCNYNGAAFNIGRTVLTDLAVEFAKAMPGK